MITKYLNKIYFLLGLILFFSACTDDLNVIPTDDDDLLSENFYANESAYEQALAGVYGNLSLTGTTGAGSSNISGIDAGTSQYGRVLWYLQDLAADEALWSYENDPGTKEIQRNIWTPANPIFRGMYGRAMFSVALANDFLRESTDEKLASRGHTSALSGEIVAYRAEARLLRSLAYYHLMDLFGKAAFVTEADPVGTFQAPQYNREQLFNFIEEELNAIEGDLNAPGTVYGRANKGVAWMILAKMYLNAEVYLETDTKIKTGESYYTLCLENCNKIFGGGYKLASDYALNFMADNNSNEAGLNEIIFPLISDGVVTQNYGPTTVIINGEVGSIEGNSEELGAQGWGGALRVRKQFAEKFLDQGDDDRNTLITEGREIDIVDVADRDSGYIITKFSNRTSTGAAGSDPTFVDTDYPLFRLADVYLMYAEAIMRRDNGVANDDAKDMVNLVRERAHASLISLNDLTYAFLIDERSRELHWESHRRQDLVRFGLYTGGNYNWAWKGNGANGIAIANHMAVYPMPSESLAANPNLTQNPGY